MSFAGGFARYCPCQVIVQRYFLEASLFSGVNEFIAEYRAFGNPFRFANFPFIDRLNSNRSAHYSACSPSVIYKRDNHIGRTINIVQSNITNCQSWAKLRNHRFLGNLYASTTLPSLPPDHKECDESYENQRPLGVFIPIWRLFLSGVYFFDAFWRFVTCTRDRPSIVSAMLLCLLRAALAFAPGGEENACAHHYCNDKGFYHGVSFPL